MPALRPFYENVQAHYDLSDEFFRLFLDPNMVYSCAFFERPDLTLEQAQLAKIDLSLGKCDLRPGMRLLDVGNGWGALGIRAATRWGARVIGLTLSRHQQQAATARAGAAGVGDRVEFRLQGWEEFVEPVDRIVSIGAFEHFRRERYPAFFRRCRSLLPHDGILMLHSIIAGNAETLAPGQAWRDRDFLDYVRFIHARIFPGGEIPSREAVLVCAKANGFDVLHLQSLRPHYARTLDLWVANLVAARDRAAALTSPRVYEDYVRYLTQSAHYFRTGHNDVIQFTMRVR